MSNRAAVVAEQVRQILSNTLLFEMRDSDLEGITITRVKVSPDLGYADIRFTYPFEEKDLDIVMAAFKRAAGIFRKKISRELKLRKTPELRFHVDEDIDAERRIGDILEKLDIPAEPDSHEG